MKRPKKTKSRIGFLKRSERNGQQVQSEPRPSFPIEHHRSPGIESKSDPAPRWQASRYRAAGKLEGKVALIPGGDSGIGRGVAFLFAREGANLAICYLPNEETDAEQVKRSVEAVGRQYLLLLTDLTKASACLAAVASTVRYFGGLISWFRRRLIRAARRLWRRLPSLNSAKPIRLIFTPIFG